MEGNNDKMQTSEETGKEQSKTSAGVPASEAGCLGSRLFSVVKFGSAAFRDGPGGVGLVVAEAELELYLETD